MNRAQAQTIVRRIWPGSDARLYGASAKTGADRRIVCDVATGRILGNVPATGNDWTPAILDAIHREAEQRGAHP